MCARYQYNEAILSCIGRMLSYMTAKHFRVLFFRFDVRFPHGYPHNGLNSELSELLKLIKEAYTRDGIELHYVWAREQDTSDVPHYHVAMTVNGSRVQDPRGIQHMAERIWQRITGVSYSGLIDFCCHDYRGQATYSHIMIERCPEDATGEVALTRQRCFEAACAEALQRGSYLAKTHTKGNAPFRVREYGASRLPTPSP